MKGKWISGLLTIATIVSLSMSGEVLEPLEPMETLSETPKTGQKMEVVTPVSEVIFGAREDRNPYNVNEEGIFYLENEKIKFYDFQTEKVKLLDWEGNITGVAAYESSLYGFTKDETEHTWNFVRMDLEGKNAEVLCSFEETTEDGTLGEVQSDFFYYDNKVWFKLERAKGKTGFKQWTKIDLQSGMIEVAKDLEAFAEEKEVIWLGSYDGELIVYRKDKNSPATKVFSGDLATGELEELGEIPNGKILSMAIDGDQLLFADFSNQQRIITSTFDLKTGEITPHFADSPEPTFGVRGRTEEWILGVFADRKDPETGKEELYRMPREDYYNGNWEKAEKLEL